jgi:hypothetical protein
VERGQLDPERGAALGPVRDADPAAVAVDDPLRDREAEAGAARRRARGAPEAVEHVGMSSSRTPGPWSRTSIAASGPRRGPRTVTSPPRGLWRTALSTRIITSWRSRAGIALDHHRLRVDDDAHAARLRGAPERPGRVERDVAEVHRLGLERDGAGIGPGEEQQVVDERREVA